MIRFANQAIAASAGTGKTWALAHRYIALMAADVPPDRICALTFSRKAAGEIFDAIVSRLCLAASSASEREVTKNNMHMPGMAVPTDAAQYARLLRNLLDRTHRLHISTLDSFILGIVRSFPLELGIPPDVRPMDNEGGEALMQRQMLLARLYDPAQHGREDGEIRAALLEAFRQATFGQEIKSLSARLDDLVASRLSFYRQHANKSWGVMNAIWPQNENCWWRGSLGCAEPDFLARLRQAFGPGSNPEKLGDACARLAESGALHAPDKPWPEKISKTIFEQLAAAAATNEPSPTLTYYKKTYSIPPDIWLPLRAAIGKLVAVEMERDLRQTSGLHALLGQYNRLYQEAQHLDGGFSFSDLSHLLADPSQQPSSQPGAPEKLYIDYRLDGRLDHWLLDEFQDTSDDQWNAISNLIAEVVQDENRSIFYVGDIKQSIYGWRSGNWRLFERVRKECLIDRPETLSDCHRSRPAIVETINRIFGHLPRDLEQGPCPESVAAFTGPQWPTHHPARNDQGAGFAALLEYAPNRPNSLDAGDDDSLKSPAESDDPAQYEAVARILAEVEPCKRGLSAAVLVRGNAQGRACVDVLRRRLPDMPVVHEGTGGIVDNPLITLLLSLVRLAAHPADTTALRHVQMSPLSDIVFPQTQPHSATATPSAGFSTRLLSSIHEQGFAGALRLWCGCLTDCGALKDDDAFGHQRMRELLAAAEAFDATGSRDTDAFDDHIRAWQVKSEAAAGAVRVMTIHQSKGLGFDLVMVPFDPKARSFTDLTSTRMLRDDCWAEHPSDNGWVLQRPVIMALEAAGEPLVSALHAARAEANFEQLCVLYVALTRAKHALYMIVPEAAKKLSVMREADLLRHCLTNESDTTKPGIGNLDMPYSAGNSEWFRSIEPPARASRQEAPAWKPLSIQFVPDIKRREPSKEQPEGKPVPVRWLLSAEAGDVPAFGSALHRLFAHITWIEESDIEAVVAAWQAESMESQVVLRDVEAQFRACMASAEVRACLTRPTETPQSEAWREAPFYFVREKNQSQEIVSGRFDRLVILRNAAGQAVGARVMDFKSNRIATEHELSEHVAAYKPQMRDYADAASRLLQLDSSRISTLLLFTRIGRVVRVAPDA